MVRIPSSGRLGRRVAAGALGISLVAAFVVQGGAAGGAPSCPVPSVFPVGSLHAGLTAVGKTVIDSTGPKAFDVTILGVQPDGIAPGLDFILAQITGPPGFLAKTGGIVAGMSGSPVTIGGQLVGSTSYGFAFADQTIVGITPAQPMVNLFSYPPSTASGLNTRASPRMAARVSLSPRLQARAARATNTRASQFATARPIPVALAVSGLNQRALARFNRRLQHFNVPVVAYKAGSSISGAPSTPIAPAESLATGLSYGDFTVAAVGTATACQGDQVVGYGHPLTFAGGVTLGMNAAEVLSVVKDPSQTFGGFKMANITDLHGTVDQDRLAGIRGTEGDMPQLTRLTAHIVNSDIPGRFRDGKTDIIRKLDLGPFFIGLPDIAAFGLLSEEDVAFDRFGKGSVGLNWVISGTAPDKSKFVLGRTDMYYSPYDATFESIFELYGQLYKLLHSGFGDATITRIKVSGTVTEEQRTSSIRRVLSSSSAQPGLRVRKTLRVHPGSTIHLRVIMHDADVPASRPVDLSLKVPGRLRGGELSIRPGRGSSGFYFGGQRVKAKSFADLVHKLSHGEHNNDLIAELIGAVGRGGAVGPPPVQKTRTTRIDRKVSSAQERVVEGRKFIRIVVR